MARNQGKSFFEAHWDWLVALAGILVAGGAYYLNYMMADDVKKATGAGGGNAEVAELNLEQAEATLRLFDNPLKLGAYDPEDPKSAFLSSQSRLFCSPFSGEPGCGGVLQENVDKCPFCGQAQKESKLVALEADSDGDGMSDVYERENGLDEKTDDGADDLDGDGFTNIEEFKAGTKPNDPLDHPDYFKTEKKIVRVAMGEPTISKLQFLRREAYKAAKGYRLYFWDASVDKTKEMTAFEGEEIKLERTGKTGKALDPISTGFTVVKYDEKSERKKDKGVGGASEKDVSTVTLKRLSDGAEFVFGLGNKKKPRETVLDAKARVEFLGLKDVDVFEVGKGGKIDLVKYGVTYTVVELVPSSDNKGVSIKLKNDITGETKLFVSE